MAGKVVLFAISLILSVIGSNAAGELTILHSPESLRFSGHSRALESVLKEIFSASLGLSVDENVEWNGMYVVDPFNTPEAVLLFYVDGISSLEETAVKSFPVDVDEYEPDTYDAIKHRINQRFTKGNSKLVSITLSNNNQLAAYPDVFGSIPAPKVTKQTLQHLKYNVEEDYQFLAELEALRAITNKFKAGMVKPDNVIDFYYLRMTTLHTLSDMHGASSAATKEAKKLLNVELRELTKAFVKAYEGGALVAALATDVAHTRRTARQAPEPPAAAPAPTAEGAAVNTGEDSSEYAAIFNIILWFSVVISFALIAIVYTIMDMDPGRDSIIYRMTNTRMKKDN